MTLLLAEGDVWTQIVAVMTPVVSSVVLAFGYLYRQIESARELHLQCEQKRANDKVEFEKRLVTIDTQLALVNAEMERREGESSANVVVNDKGYIREWSPGATILFRWKQVDALGKHITTLIPERERARFTEAWERMIGSGRLPRHGPFKKLALLKTGEEICVSLVYTGWVLDTGERMFGATARLSEGEPDAPPDH